MARENRTDDLPQEGSKEEDPSAEISLERELDEALLALDELIHEDPEEALSMFDSLPHPIGAMQSFQLLLARAHQAKGQAEAARDLLSDLLKQDPNSSDIHHQLADVLEDLGEVTAANQHFLKVRELDDAAFQKLDETERGNLDRAIQCWLGEVRSALPRLELLTHTAPLPSEKEILDGIDPRRLCRWDAQSQTLVAYIANLAAEFGDVIAEPETTKEAARAMLRDIAEEIPLTPEEQELLFRGQSDAFF